LWIVSSTIAYNEIIGEDPFGGGVYNGGVSTEIISSTIVGNRTVGDLVDYPELVSAAGVYADYAITITDSIIVGNIASSGGAEIAEYAEADGGEGDGIITFTGQNIIGTNASGYDASGLANVRNGSLADLFSGGLADNGGPVQTIALSSQVSNLALDVSNAMGTDARGEARGVDLAGVANGGTSDLGAFELQDQPRTFPEFTSPDFVLVAENLTFVIDAEAIDAVESEGNGLTYSLFETVDSELFSVNAATGVLTFNQAPDFENPQDANGKNL